MKTTALYTVHREAGARFVEFAGWEMPVQYEGVREEHIAVRESVGLFDVSHMGEVEVTGPEALDFCQYVTTNDVRQIERFQAQYTLLCNNRGGVVDDVIIYRFSDERIFICVNASNTDKDFKWLERAAGEFDVNVADRSPEFSQIALQGPDSEVILSAVLNEDLSALKRFRFRVLEWGGHEIIVARTGYTGEDGFEIFLPWDDGPSLWRAVMEAGAGYGIKPCGLAARDTLRIEMGYSLYGHEIDEDINPIEAGLGRYVKLDKGDFIGRQALMESVNAGLKNTLVGFEMLERGIPRQGYNIFKNGKFLGKVTSGTMSPLTDKSIGMGFLSNEYHNDGRIDIEIRNTQRDAQVVDMPFNK